MVVRPIPPDAVQRMYEMTTGSSIPGWTNRGLARTQGTRIRAIRSLTHGRCQSTVDFWRVRGTEDKRVAVRVDDDELARTHQVEQDPLGERVLDLALDRPAQRSSTHGGIPTRLCALARGGLVMPTVVAVG